MTQGERTTTRNRTTGRRYDPALTPESVQALEHLHAGIEAGKPWPVTLLEAVGMWTSPKEQVNGVKRSYLINQEAFDVLELAYRLGEEVAEKIPGFEWRQFRVHGKLPPSITEEDFHQLVGETKLKGILNYWYGVALEGALQSAVRDEIRKDRANVGLKSQTGVLEQAFIRIYSAPRTVLLQQFREKFLPEHEGPLTPAERKHFTYWLFKMRLDLCEKERVASDTRKAILWLQRKHPEPLLRLLPGLAFMEAYSASLS